MSQNKPKISIVIPVYNVQDYLRKCLDSICGQTYQNLEIICIDDRSTDASMEILNEYASKDTRVRVVQQEKNGGQGAARQTGIDVATGDYIAFVDSDDWLDDDYYEKMLFQMECDLTDIVVNKNILFHEKDKVYPKNFPGHKTIQNKIYDQPKDLIERVFCVVWNKLYKAEFLKQRNYDAPVRIRHEDVFFHYATFAFAKNVSFFDGPSYHYLFREESDSNKKHDWGVGHIRVYSQIYDFYQENNLLKEKIKLYATMPFFVIKNEEMFNEYKHYFLKVEEYMNENKDVFFEADVYIANCIIKCKDYSEYASQYSPHLTMLFLRRKR